MSSNVPKPSLVCQYDDLVRNTNILTEGTEKDFIAFVKNQKNLHVTSKASNAENQSLEKRIKELTNVIKGKDVQIKMLKERVISAHEKATTSDRHRKSMVRQINLIKEILVNGGIAMDTETKQRLLGLSSPSRMPLLREESGSLLSSSDEDDDDIFSHGATDEICPPESNKRRKTEVVFADGGPTVHHLGVTFRSNSEPREPAIQPLHRSAIRSDSEQITKTRSSEVRLLQGTNRRASRLSIGGAKLHKFQTKMAIKTEKCHPCGKPVRFCKQVLKCSDCKITCHVECKEKCPPPCIVGPSSPPKSSTSVSDFAPSVSPMIPPLIFHCVNEVENRGFKEIGLYRVSGRERTVKELKEKLLHGKNFPCLAQYDVHVICGVIKDFIRSLDEPLIPTSILKSITESVDIESEHQRAIQEQILKLPPANKDTLAYLVVHFKRVSEFPDCRMSLENIAKVIAPSFVGHSEKETVCLVTETKQQFKIMEEILNLPTTFWESILNFEDEPVPFGKPDHVSSPLGNGLILGPVYAFPNKPLVDKTPLAPRRVHGTKSEKRRFFQSPTA